MTAIHVPPSVEQPAGPPRIVIESRAASRADVQLSLAQDMARAQMVWEGFRHPSVADPLESTTTTSQTLSDLSTWAAFANELFQGSRGLTADEATEIDRVLLRDATPTGIRRTY